MVPANLAPGEIKMKNATATVLNDKGDSTYFVMTSLGFTTFATSPIPLVPGDRIEITLHGRFEDEAIVVKRIN